MTSQAVRNKRRGADWECDLLAWVQENVDRHAVRPRLNGTQDMGDVQATVDNPAWLSTLRLVLEAKNPSRDGAINLNGWRRETEQETANANADLGVLVIRRNGSTDPGQAHAVLPLATLVALLRGEP